MPTVLITGANRGIGLEFVRQYAQSGWNVIACSRSDGSSVARIPAVEHHSLEVTDFGAVAALARALAGRPIDVLINNAGIAGREAGDLGSVDPAVWQQTFLINALAPLKMAEAFVDHVAASQARKLIAITSRLGSIALNDGARYAYRASKAALNCEWKSLSSDLRPKGVICAVLHPGWVRTDMGGASAPVVPTDSVTGMIGVIGRLKPQDSGGFFNYDGAPIEW